MIIITSLPLSLFPSRLHLPLSIINAQPMANLPSGHLHSLHTPAKQEEGVSKNQASGWRLVKRHTWRNAQRVGAIGGKKANRENNQLSDFFPLVVPWGFLSRGEPDLPPCCC